MAQQGRCQGCAAVAQQAVKREGFTAEGGPEARINALLGKPIGLRLQEVQPAARRQETAAQQGITQPGCLLIVALL